MLPSEVLLGVKRAVVRSPRSPLTAPHGRLPRLKPSSTSSSDLTPRLDVESSLPTPSPEPETGVTVREDDEVKAPSTRWEKVERAVGWKRSDLIPHIPHPDREVNGPIPLWVLAATPITVALVAVFGFNVFNRALEASPSHYLQGRVRNRANRPPPRPDLTAPPPRQGLVF
jgi:hypothetical protein